MPTLDLSLTVISFLCTWRFIFWGVPKMTVFFLAGIYTLAGFLHPAAPVILLVTALILKLFHRNKTIHQPEIDPYPILSIESDGIRYGLTAPQAAILLDMPSLLVNIQVIAGLFQKGLISLDEQNPGRVVIPAPLQTSTELDPRERRKLRRIGAQKLHAVLHVYEDSFLELMEKNYAQELFKINYGLAQEGIRRSLNQRMAGFDIDATKTHYSKTIDWVFAQAVEQSIEMGVNDWIFQRLDWSILHPEALKLLKRMNPDKVPAWFGFLISNLESLPATNPYDS